MPDPVLLVRDEVPVRWLTLNRPDKRNALNAELIAALTAALEATPQDDGIRCLALTGAGKVFSAGADLAALRAMMDAGEEENLADSRTLARLLSAIQGHPLPVIAALNGHAIAGGAGLSAACDLTIAVREAQLGFPEVRIGFLPAIVLNFLLRTLGHKAARDLCLTGRRIGADDALAMGLINEVCEQAQLQERVRAIGAEIAQCSPEAVAATKLMFLELGAAGSLEEGLEIAVRLNADARMTDDCREGVTAFLEKRKPRWHPNE